VRVDILITRGKHLHNSIISQGGEWGHKTRLAPTLCIAVPVSVHTSERSCCFVLKISIFLFLRYTYLIVHSSVSSNVYSCHLIVIFIQLLALISENTMCLIFLQYSITCMLYSKIDLVCSKIDTYF
jgi:hypothetical protein